MQVIGDFIEELINEEEEEEDDHVIGNFIQELIEDEVLQAQRKVRFQELRLQRRVLRDTCNPFTLDPEYFRKYYRFTPEIALILINLIKDRIVREHRDAIPAHIQILIVLRFLAEGGYQKGFGQDFNHPVSQSTVSLFVDSVLNAINTLANRVIVFPDTFEERDRIQRNFQQKIRIPGIIGLVDGFLVCFIRPPEYEEAFYNYRVGTSMNVQIVADSDYVIRNLRICPGSNNDRFIWQHSEANDRMEALRANIFEEGPYYILGDSGYTPSPVLLTPVLNAPEGSPEAVYTSEHVRTRTQIERTIGILTGVWRAINRARKLHYSPQKVANIIQACAILHNFRREHGIIEEIDELDDNINEVFPEEQIHGNYQDGIAERNRLINLYYR